MSYSTASMSAPPHITRRARSEPTKLERLTEKVTTAPNQYSTHASIVRSSHTIVLISRIIGTLQYLQGNILSMSPDCISSRTLTNVGPVKTSIGSTLKAFPKSTKSALLSTQCKFILPLASIIKRSNTQANTAVLENTGWDGSLALGQLCSGKVNTRSPLLESITKIQN